MTTSVVYVDGACAENGQDNAQAAIGVFWNDNDEKNISEFVPVDQPQTNGYTQLSAVIKAIETAVNEGCCYYYYYYSLKNPIQHVDYHD